MSKSPPYTAYIGAIVTRPLLIHFLITCQHIVGGIVYNVPLVYDAPACHYNTRRVGDFLLLLTDHIIASCHIFRDVGSQIIFQIDFPEDIGVVSGLYTVVDSLLVGLFYSQEECSGMLTTLILVVQ